MKERPILFSGPMVRAICDGTKSQTRRVVTARGWDPRSSPQVKMVGQAFFRADDGAGVDWLGVPCPFGEPGDRLWVRETWGLRSYADETDWHRASVRGASASILGHWRVEYNAEYGSNQETCHWRPSIHMPRWASRILLEVTDVRVERLQDISEQDILAEGVTVDRVAEWTGTPWSDMPTLHDAWRVLWDSINGKRAPWSSDPWCWAVSFKRVSP